MKQGPGLILLRGDLDACREMEDALMGHPTASKCEVWNIPDAKDGIYEDVLRQGGEVWLCLWDDSPEILIHRAHPLPCDYIEAWNWNSAAERSLAARRLCEEVP